MPSASVTPAFEDPMPVRNGLIVEASAPTNGAERPGALEQDVLQQLEDFLSEQADCLRRELA